MDGTRQPRTVFAMDVIDYADDHAEQLLDVLDALRGQSYPGPLAGDTRATMGAWLTRYPASHRLVALDGGTVVGHVQVMEIGPDDSGLLELLERRLGPVPVLEVSRLFLRLDYRGSGAGRDLLAAATQWAWDQGVHPVLRVSDHLGAAVHLYERAGWQPLGSLVSRLSADTLLVLAAPPPSLCAQHPAPQSTVLPPAIVLGAGCGPGN